MTREEAIERLVDLRVQFQVGIFTREAIDMAIKALQADAVSVHIDYAPTPFKIKTTSVGTELITDDRLDVDRIYCSPQIADSVVRVVRCKDCRHIGLFSCPLADNDFQKDEDFCSWGERREP